MDQQARRSACGQKIAFGPGNFEPYDVKRIGLVWMYRNRPKYWGEKAQ